MSTPPPQDPYGGYGQNPGGFSGPPPGGYGPPGGFGPPQGGYGPPAPQPPHFQPIPNYMWQSVTITVLSVLCCNLLTLAFGIVAIVNATRVQGRQQGGDVTGALSASKNAKTWCIVAVVVWAVSLVVWIALVTAGIIDATWRFDYDS